MKLFRDEMIAHRAESLHGTINLALPLSWPFISASLASIVVAAGMFLASASYSRSEIASGTVVPRAGILQVTCPRSGRVEAVTVQEGQFVRRGNSLAKIRVEETDGSGAGIQTAALSAIDKQRRGLTEQELLARSAAGLQQAEYDVRIDGYRQELSSLETQIAVQRRLVDMAQADLSQISEIAARGFISKRDLANREETLLSRQQQLAVLQQASSAKLSAMQQEERARKQAALTASGAAAGLNAARAQVERERVGAKGAQGYSLLAPTDGQVAALALHVGDSVDVQEPAMMIVPGSGDLVARLTIPGKAAGFVRAGQPVRLALDAFPHDRFGTVEGVITSVSSAPVLRNDKDGSSEAIYIAMATIRRPSVRAYGRIERLLPGMTFSARIVTERRSLLEWLFDPLLAAARG